MTADTNKQGFPMRRRPSARPTPQCSEGNLSGEGSSAMFRMPLDGGAKDMKFGDAGGQARMAARLHGASHTLHDRDENPALAERQKALSQAAFVRYTTSNIVDPSPCRGDGGAGFSHPPAPTSHKLDKIGFPGELHHQDEVEWAQSPEGLLMTAAQLRLLKSSFEVDSIHAGPLMYRNNLNGIGHPSLGNLHLPGARQSGPPPIPTSSYSVKEAQEPSEEYLPYSRSYSGPSPPRRGAPTATSWDQQRGADDGLSILLTSRHWKGIPMLKPLKGGAEGLPSNAKDVLVVSHEQGAQRPAMRRIDSLLPPARNAPPPVVVSHAKPVDTLNLWQGKRLTRTEMKIEQRLHVLRLNPVAKVELKGRVQSYIHDKVLEQQERHAIAELAAERREQKAVEFLQARFKTTKKESVPPTALFDPSTGLPRSDIHPLPPTSQGYWVGLADLSKKLLQMKRLLEQRANERRMLSVLASSAATIQRFFRGFKDRERLRKERAEHARDLRVEQERLHALQQANASQTVLAFLEFASTAKRSYGDKTIAAIWGSGATIKSRQRDNNLFRRVRLEVLLGQWAKVERRCIECGTKRMRSMMIGELQEVREGQNVVTTTTKETGQGRKKGMASASSYVDESDVDGHIRKEVLAAVHKTSPADRLIIQSMKPVPKPVKVAVLHVFMAQRFKAYVMLMGVYWRDKARSMVLNRKQAVKDAAMRVMRGEKEHSKSTLSAEGATSMEREAASIAAVAAATVAAAELLKTTLPRFRMMATLPEMKVLMQQGVAETPSFQGFLVRGGLQAYEQQIAKQMTDGTVKSRDRTSEMGAQSAEAALDIESEVENPKSFTLTLLMHRWDRECKPRIKACMEKRMNTLHVDMVECLGHNGIWLPHEEMGSKLMELRDG